MLSCHPYILSCLYILLTSWLLCLLCICMYVFATTMWWIKMNIYSFRRSTQTQTTDRRAEDRQTERTPHGSTGRAYAGTARQKLYSNSSVTQTTLFANEWQMHIIHIYHTIPSGPPWPTFATTNAETRFSSGPLRMTAAERTLNLIFLTVLKLVYLW